VRDRHLPALEFSRCRVCAAHRTPPHAENDSEFGNLPDLLSCSSGLRVGQVHAALVAVLLAIVLVLVPVSRGDAVSSAATNGQIAYDRADPRSPDDTFVYTANPDGSRARRLMAKHTCCPGWSHDGRTLAIPASLPADRLTTATVGAGGQSYKVLPIKDRTLSVACAGGAWSPDDTQLACESWDDSRPSRNGIYIRSSSAGGAAKRLTSSPGGGDLPGSYSPDGRHIVFARFDKNGTSRGLFVINADGRREHRITPLGIIMQGGNTGDWSPKGNDIIFSRKAREAGPGSIWIIRADGSHLRQLKVRGLACGGSIGCHGPRWSPDGRKFVFAAKSASASNIYAANSDGTGLVQVTHDGHSDGPSWGTHPRSR
jgi:WD40-like Beta Propeller Repeat